MVIVTAGTAALVAAGSTGGAPFAGIATGLGISVLGKMVGGTGALSTAAGAVAGSASAGTIIGAAWSGTLAGAIASGLAAVASSGAFAVTQNVLAGPVGLLVLGASPPPLSASQSSTAEHRACTFDCWKSVLRDKSTEMSDGMLLRDVVADARIKEVTVDDGLPLPGIVLHNVWGERFRLEYVPLPTSLLAVHAVRLS